MPLYRCPKCGRTVELPEGEYYCKYCGSDAVMVKQPSFEEKVRELASKLKEEKPGVISWETIERVYGLSFTDEERDRIKRYWKHIFPPNTEISIQWGITIPKHVEQKQVLSVSGLCHTLTSEEYEVLEALDEYASAYGKEYANLWWIARKYQDRFVGRITPLLKSSIDRTRNILFELWRKGMVEPESVTVKTVRMKPRDYVPKTKKEAAKVSE
ncbi:hypothetical protein DRO59_09610, partial [Candidatus Bathyarchaeota archaeon]